ncbi:acireductone synthase [Sphingobium sp. AN558]|uniref:acireductone synthase n=1 Tax=Sphingobium sp. AN558 TaxID=3133442 RepID=UPI0030C26E61
MTPRAIVTDIEGTTSSLSFVHDILFPYSRARLANYVAAHAQDVGPILDAVRQEAGDPSMDSDGCIARMLEWHDADRKIGSLKTLQGLIWKTGFESGVLKGHVYADAVDGLRRWHARGIALYIYSSGSIEAQKLLFGHTEQGDLTPLFTGHFDTAIGGKKEAGAYRAIAAQIGIPPADILFLSDIEAELAAAQEAGFAVTLLVREGPLREAGFPAAADFDSILPEVQPA